VPRAFARCADAFTISDRGGDDEWHGLRSTKKMRYRVHNNIILVRDARKRAGCLKVSAPSRVELNFFFFLNRTQNLRCCEEEDGKQGRREGRRSDEKNRPE